MITIARFGLFLLGILQVLQFGSAGLTKRLIFGHGHHAQTCAVPSTGVYSRYQCPSTAYNEGEVCTISCVPGYTLRGSPNTITCHDGQWSATLATCEATAHPCPVPSVPTNGHVSCASHQVGAQCTVHCHKGYTAAPAAITCNSAGGTSHWSHAPTCKASHCPAPPQVTNGSYKCPAGRHLVDTVCTLHCHSGFKASSAHSDIKCHAADTWSSPAGCIRA